jgi:hypothetical protein
MLLRRGRNKACKCYLTSLGDNFPAEAPVRPTRCAIPPGPMYAQLETGTGRYFLFMQTTTSMFIKPTIALQQGSCSLGYCHHYSALGPKHKAQALCDSLSRKHKAMISTGPEKRHPHNLYFIRLSALTPNHHIEPGPLNQVPTAGTVT